MRFHPHFRTHGHKYVIGLAVATTLKVLGIKSIIALFGLTTVLNSLGMSFADDVVIETDLTVADPSANSSTDVSSQIVQDIVESQATTLLDALLDTVVVSSSDAVINNIVPPGDNQSVSTLTGLFDIVVDLPQAITTSVDVTASSVQPLIDTVVETLPQVDFFTMLAHTDQSVFQDADINIQKTDDSVIATSADEKLKVILPDSLMVSIDSTDLPYTDSLVLDTVSLSDTSLKDVIDTSVSTVISAMSFGSDSLGLSFSDPIQISMDIDKPDGTIIDMTVVHDGGVVSNMLSDDVLSTCTNTYSSAPVSQFVVTNKKIIFTTCGASIFVASSLITVTDPNVFVTTWKTDNTGVSNSTSITLPMVGGPYDVDWNSDGIYDQFGLNGLVTHDFGSVGTYTVSVSGAKGFQLGWTASDALKLLSVDQWGTSVWTTLSSAFREAKNMHIWATDAPNLSAVTSLNGMFYNAQVFNEDISHWNVSHVTDMYAMFLQAKNFNQPLNTLGWDTANVTNMQSMFEGATSFNQDIGGWNTSKVTDMSYMFYNATSFNQNIGGWDTSKVLYMHHMFRNATSFNQNIGGWDTSKVLYMYSMFRNATVFDQNIGGWNVASVLYMSDMFVGAKLSSKNYDGLLTGWDAQILNPNVTFYGGSSNYCLGSGARANMIGSDGWTITDGGYNCPVIPLVPFVTTWKTDNTGTSNNTSITVPLVGGPYDVDWNNDGIYDQFGLNGSVTHDFGSVGTYAVSVSGAKGFQFGLGTNDASKLLSVDQWGTTVWNTLSYAFANASHMHMLATDVPNLSAVTNLGYMFYGATLFNENINNRDVSHITNMQHMFSLASSFNQPLDRWNIANVTDMSSMFSSASSFNQPLGSTGWNTSNVTTMAGMFAGASLFDQSLASWNTSNVTHMGGMFSNASVFNQSLNTWNVGNVTDMRAMFSNASVFNQPLNTWDVSNVTDMYAMFSNVRVFNQPLNNWNVSNVTNMGSMFSNASVFDQPLHNWNVSKVTNMASLFQGAASFNQPLNTWNVSKVTNMESLFQGAAAFNQPLNAWNTSNVTDMSGMFSDALTFNNSLSGWDTFKITDMSYMFNRAMSFNQSLATWNVANVTTMYSMFAEANAFNQDLGKWNTANLINASWMFNKASSFDQNIGSWAVSKIQHMDFMFQSAKLSRKNYDALLTGWDAQSLKSNVTFHGGSSKYCLGTVARANVVTSDAWTITADGGRDCTDLIPTTPLVAPDMTSATDLGISSIDNITSDSTPDFAMSCESTGNMLILYIDGIANGTGVCNGLSLITPSVLSDGTHIVTSTESGLGGESGQSPGLSILIDTTAPMIPTVTTIGGDATVSYITAQANPNIVGTAESGSLVEIKINGITYSGTTNGSGVYSITIPGLGDGTYNADISSKDGVGNESGIQTVQFTIDTTAPLVPICTANPNPTSGNVSITCNGIETGATTTISGLTCNPSISTGGVVTCTGILPSSDPMIIVTDDNGNIGTGIVLVELDTTAPMIPTVTTIGGDATVSYITAQANPNIVGTAESGSIVEIKINGITYSGTTNGSGVYSINIPGLGDGTYNADIISKDGVGNESGIQTVQFTIDTTAPVVPKTVSTTGALMHIETGVLVELPNNAIGGGVGGSVGKDFCPIGDYTLSYYDGVCGVKSPDTTTGAGGSRPISGPSGLDPAIIQFDDADVYNDSITDGYCFNKKTNVKLIDSLSLTTTIEFKKAMTFLYSYDVTELNAIDDFAPFDYLTREQAAKMFSKFAMNVLCRKPNKNLNISYTDINTATPSLKNYITLAYQLGLMKGSPDGTFRPYDTITRAEFNAVLIRMILQSYLSETGGTHWYDEYNKVSLMLGVIQYNAGEVPVIRNDSSLMLFRAYKNQKFSLTLSDYESFVLSNRSQFIGNFIDQDLFVSDGLSGDSVLMTGYLVDGTGAYSVLSGSTEFGSGISLGSGIVQSGANTSLMTGRIIVGTGGLLIPQ